MRRYLGDLRNFGGHRLAFLSIVTAASALTDSIGLLMLVPLLEIVGVGAGSGIGDMFVGIFDALGIDLTLRSVLALYVLLMMARAALGRVRSVQVARFQMEFVDWQRFRLFEAIARADWLSQVRRRASDVMYGVTTDIARVGQGTNLLLQAATKIVLAIAYGLVAVRISPAVTALAVAFSLGLSAILWPLVRRARELGTLQTTAGRRTVAAIADLMAGLKVAKVHGAEQQHLDEFQAAVAELRAAQFGFQRVEAVANFAYQVAMAAGMAVVVLICVEVLEVPTAELLALLVVLSRMLPVAGGVLTNVRSAANMLPAYASAMSTLDQARLDQERPATLSDPRPIEREIELSGVSFAYPEAGGPSLEGIHLTLRARTTTALVGPSGAGKTTLADIVLGLLPPSQGLVLVDGVPLDDIDLGSWRSTVAYVPQDPFLFHSTIRHNVTWPDAALSDDDVLELLVHVGLGDLMASLPQGLSTIVGDRGHRLSGGERQRVVLARAMARKPRLLVLDEATSHLDVTSELAAKRAIDALRGNLTVLVIAHRLATVRGADQIVVLDKGRVREVGTWSRLESNGGMFHQMLQATEG